MRNLFRALAVLGAIAMVTPALAADDTKGTTSAPGGSNDTSMSQPAPKTGKTAKKARHAKRHSKAKSSSTGSSSTGSSSTGSSSSKK